MTPDVPVKRRTRLLAGLGCLLATAMAPAAEAPVRLVGTDYFGPELIRSLAAVSSREGRSARVELQGTRPALNALRDGRADLALLLLPDGEAAPGDPYTVRLIGWHVTVVAAGPGDTRARVTAEELGAVLQAAKEGQVADHARLIVLAPKVSPAWSVMQRRVGEGAKGPVERIEGREALADRLRHGSAGLAVADLGVPEQPGVRWVPWAETAAAPAVRPDLASVSSGRYPLRLPLWIAFRRSDVAGLRPWLRFLLGDEAAGAMQAAGFLPLPPGDRARLALELDEMAR